MTLTERLEKAQKKNYRIYTYLYSRYNPQLGDCERTSEVIASSDAEARKLASYICESTVYGSNTFLKLVSKSNILPREAFDFEIRNFGKMLIAKRNYGSEEYNKAFEHMNPIIEK